MGDRGAGGAPGAGREPARPSGGDRGRRPAEAASALAQAFAGARAVLRGRAPGRARRRLARAPPAGTAGPAPRWTRPGPRRGPGRLREAGLIYERLIAQGSAEESGAARLALGRLLARVGRTEDAARHLQAAARIPAWQTQAWRALCGPLLALGLRGAAAELADRLRARDPASPPTPDEIASLEEAHGEAAAGGSGELGGRYQLRRLLGAGAVGRVYEAFDNLLGAAVALKLVAVGGGTGDNERQAYARFAREAEAAGRLRHPNIVALADANAGAGLFVFELMIGGTLADRLAAEGPLTPAAARRLALDLLAALAAAHERGIIHRDVKPSNVFFDAAGNAKLGDFGSAHLADFGQTQTGGFFGTVAYMSPEQITGAPIGHAADLYALGATLLEALTGSPPFLGPDLVAQHLGEAPPSPSARRPGLAPAHDAVLARALAKSPAERFASALEMAEAVLAWPVDLVAAPIGRATRARARPEAAPRRPRPPTASWVERPTGGCSCATIARTGPRRAGRRAGGPAGRSGARRAARARRRRRPPRPARAGAVARPARRRLRDPRRGCASPSRRCRPPSGPRWPSAFAALPPGRATHFVRTAAGPVLWIAPPLA